MRRALILILTIIMVASVTGCVTKSDKVASLPLVSALTEKEVRDYYAKSLSYDTIAKRDINIHKTEYQTYDVDEALSKELTKYVGNIEETLRNQYVENEYIDESTYVYIKSFLNEKALTRDSIVSVKAALGYYFVDVDYKVSYGSIGKFTDGINYLGINGAFIKTLDGRDTLDNSFILNAVETLNNYYAQNNINKSVEYDEYTKKINMVNAELPGNMVIGKYNKGSEQSTSSTYTGDIQFNTVNYRGSKVDIKEVNSIAGSAMSNAAYMPDLSVVYEVPSSKQLSGFGIYPSGCCGLTEYGVTRSSLTGSLTIRYVFKDSKDGNKIVGYNAYPISYVSDSSVEDNLNSVTVPSFIYRELSKVIERADRAISNGDIVALNSGYIYSDAGKAVIVGLESNYVNVARNKSTVRRVLDRKIGSNTYLIEVETTRQEGSKGSDTFGTYVDTKCIVVEQVGTEFIITDELLLRREMVSEPVINPESYARKRLVALNLAGEVKDKDKADIQTLLSDLYTAGTYRLLRGPKDITVDGQTITLEKGMYDCFNSNTELLSEDDLEYMNESLRELLIKHGVSVKAKYSGVVTEWVGGTGNQAELITEELINYDGIDTGTYMQVYYLVSSMDGVWVIDDMVFIEEKELSGTELQSVVDRIK